jgi:hypothetical protein
MAAPGFWDSIGRDLTGRGIFGGSFQFRYLLQPLAAIIAGARIGVRDAKEGRLPFFKALLHDKGKRGNLLAKAVRDAIVPLAFAFLMDSVLQHMINGRVRPLVAVIVGTMLVFVPFVIVRALANRIWTHGHSGHDRPVKQAG